MKFAVRTLKNGCRLGSITSEVRKSHELENATPTQNVETPMCMLYTRAGSAAHLTRAVLDRVEHLPPVAQMPLTLIADNHDIIAEYGKGMKAFAVMEDFLMYSSLQDPACEVPLGYNDKNGVSIWGRGGKMKLDVDLLIKVQEALQPDWYQAVADSDTANSDKCKRCRKGVDRTLKFLDQIIEKHEQSQLLRDASLIGVIVGGYNEEQRIRSAKETAMRRVAGFSIEGLHQLGPDSEKFSLESAENLLKLTLAELPSDKPRFLPGPLPPNSLLKAISYGFDVFDSSYAYLVTERGAALVFSFEAEQNPSDGENSNRCPLHHQGYEIDLKDKKYGDDVSPLREGCMCYTCSNHSRAYINHLLNTSELLAGVLLMVHNFQHYFHFMETVRTSLHKGTFEKLNDLIESQSPR